MILRDPLQDRVLARDMYPTFFSDYTIHQTRLLGVSSRERKKNLEKAVTQLESPMMIMIVMMMQTLMVESEDTTENLRVVVAETHQRALLSPCQPAGENF